LHFKKRKEFLLLDFFQPIRAYGAFFKAISVLVTGLFNRLELMVAFLDKFRVVEAKTETT